MKLALLSDIHANRQALEAALAHIEGRTVDAVYCLGDVVGYGADAPACVDLVRAHCAGVVRGNHDEAVALDRGVSVLPRDGRAAVRLHQKQLSPDQRAYLADLPLRLEAAGCTFVHAGPRDPGAWERIETFLSAKAQFAHFDTAVCFVGHTHLPAVLADRLGVLRVRPGHRYLINVGSVGQPRDGNPRLCVAYFDTETFDYELVRLPYDVEGAAARIREEGLPEGLARRLLEGR